MLQSYNRLFWILILLLDMYWGEAVKSFFSFTASNKHYIFFHAQHLLFVMVQFRKKQFQENLNLTLSFTEITFWTKQINEILIATNACDYMHVKNSPKRCTFLRLSRWVARGQNLGERYEKLLSCYTHGCEIISRQPVFFLFNINPLISLGVWLITIYNYILIVRNITWCLTNIG